MNFIQTNRLSKSQIKQLHLLYQKEWWSKGRTLEQTRKAVKGSNYIFGICEGLSDRLVAFARVITDHVFKAWIFDVIVDQNYREKGLGKILMDSILKHSSLKRVGHIELYCLPEMKRFYKKWNFKIKNKIILMRRSLKYDK